MDIPGSPNWHRSSSQPSLHPLPTGLSSSSSLPSPPPPSPPSSSSSQPIVTNGPINGYACDSISNTASNSCTAASRSVALLRAKLREKIAQLFYYHGLNCFRHPLLLVITSLMLFSVCIYPIVGVHLFQNDYSQQYMTELSDFVALRNLNQQLHMHAMNSEEAHHQSQQRQSQSRSPEHVDLHSTSSSSSIFGNTTSMQDFLLRQGFDLRKELKNPPRWFLFRDPYAYVMQIVVKSSVNPWKDNLILMDAIRAPLGQVFQLVETISNFQHRNTSDSPAVSLNDLCLQVSEPTLMDKDVQAYLPKYSCLMLSPANIWKNDINKFLQDSEIIKTMFGITDTSSLEAGSLKELLFGIPWMQTGIRQMYVRTRQRTISFAITLVFKHFDEDYVLALKTFLRQKYPTDPFKTEGKPTSELNAEELQMFTNYKIAHLYFQNKINCSEYFPLILTYLTIYVYVYFSVRKMDIIRKKWLLATATLLTVILSLLMSVGICFWFDFNPTINGSDILPYVVMIIGLENVLVLTKSVISTPKHLDMKIRMAQALSKESSPILTNLSIELTVLAIAFFTFIPIIQDMCLFGVVALFSDLFMQMTFFGPILASNLIRPPSQKSRHKKQPSNGKPLSFAFKNSTEVNADTRNGLRTGLTKIFVRPSPPIPFKLPKRLRFIYFWASKRIAHKFILVCFVGWVSVLLCKTAIFDSLSGKDKLLFFPSSNDTNSDFTSKDAHVRKVFQAFKKGGGGSSTPTTMSDVYRNKHNKFTFSNLLSSQHWSTLFWNYNISLKGKYLTILPSLHLSIPVDPIKAIQIRHPSESDPQIFRQYLFSGSQSPVIDTNDDYFDEEFMPLEDQPQIGFFNLPGKSMLFTAVFGFLIIILIVSLLTSLYKCICSRQYAEWRTSWNRKGGKIWGTSGEQLENLITDALPWKFKAHAEEIEFICSNSADPVVASCDFQGDIRVWDILSGESYTFIDRSQKTRTHLESQSNQSDQIKSKASAINNSNAQCSTITPVKVLTSHDNGSTKKNGFNFSSVFERMNTSKGVLSELISKAKSNQNSNQDYRELPVSNFIVRSRLRPQSVWCMKFYDRFLFLGCANGRIEVWHAHTGELCFYNELSTSGVTAITAAGNKMFTARLDGTVDVFEQELRSDDQSTSENYVKVSTSNVDLSLLSSSSSASSFAHQRTLPPSQQSTSVPSSAPIPSSSSSSLSSSLYGPFHHLPTQSSSSPSYLQKANHITFRFLQTINAHKQPITCLAVSSNHLISAGADHLLKVYRIDGVVCTCVYNFHGHLGPITCLEIDQPSNYALSGCQLGQVCVWDLLTGTCVFSLEAHQGPISSLLSTPLYIVSASLDNRINVWDKYTGHLITTIHEKASMCQQVVVFANNILVTAKEDELHLWEVSEGKLLKKIAFKLPSDSKYACIRNLSLCLRGKVLVCDYGTNLCLIHFLGMQKHD